MNATRAAPREKPPLEILVVDDDKMDIKFLNRAFEKVRRPHNVNSVFDGRQAMAYLRGQGDFAAKPKPDLIFLDLNMPRMNGYEVLAELKGDPALCDIPVIILTTSKDEGTVRRAYRSQANSYIVKPVSFDDLVHVASAVAEYWLKIVKLPPKPGAV